MANKIKLIYERMVANISPEDFVLTDDCFKKKSKLMLRLIFKFDQDPHRQRLAAKRLYELGVRRSTSDLLISHLNLYKKPEASRKDISLACYAAEAIGRLKISQALPLLLESLDSLPAFTSSYALSLLNDEQTIIELTREASLETRRGVQAVIALGYMGNESALPYLLEIIKKETVYDTKFDEPYRGYLSNSAFRLLGLYNDVAAEKIFIKHLTEKCVGSFIADYVHHEKLSNPYQGSAVGWQITKKYGWNQYLDSDANSFACMSVAIDYWSKLYNSDCPFKTQDDADALRQDICKKVWSGVVDLSQE